MRVAACHYVNHETLVARRVLTRAQEFILNAIWLQTIDKARPSALMPRASLAKLAGLSDTGTKKGLDSLVEAELVDRTYVCYTCEGSLGPHFADIHIGRCPHCNTHLHKRIWVRLELSTRGHEIAPLLSVINIHTVEEAPPPLSTQSLEWASRAARLLRVDNPSQEEALAKFREYEHSLVRLESDWELALAYACEEFRCHTGAAKAVVSLVGVIRWGLRTVIERTPQAEGRYPCPLEPEITARMNYIIDHMHTIAASNLTDDTKHTERLILVLYLQDTVLDHPTYAAGIDKMTLEAGLEPRALLPAGATAATRLPRAFSPPARLLWHAN